jgi:hypothetical protein
MGQPDSGHNGGCDVAEASLVSATWFIALDAAVCSNNTVRVKARNIRGATSGLSGLAAATPSVGCASSACRPTTRALCLSSRQAGRACPLAISLMRTSGFADISATTPSIRASCRVYSGPCSNGVLASVPDNSWPMIASATRGSFRMAMTWILLSRHDLAIGGKRRPSRRALNAGFESPRRRAS